MALTLELAERIDPIAIYAALVSTALLIWDVVKWLRSGPILKGSASPNITTFNMGPMDDQTHLLITVDNVGTQPTTIKTVYLKGFTSRLSRLFGKPARNAVLNSGLQHSYPLPYKLDVGSDFRASAVQTTELEEWSREHCLYVEIVHTGGRALKMRVPPI